MAQKKALVCGAGGFIPHHLVNRLAGEGYWVRGVDIKEPEFSPSQADDFQLLDLRDPDQCAQAVAVNGGFDEVYQLAADMGGMGFIHSAECEIMRNNALININTVDASARAGIGRYFYSSSVCIYRDMEIGEPEINEDAAYPALPDNEYGWEKLYSERTVMAYGRRFEFPTRILRFQNTFGPLGTWTGGREKAPAAMCRKVAEAPNGGEVEMWGDGSAVRSYTYVDDLIDGIRIIMDSDEARPCNIGNPEYVSVNELLAIVAEVAGKTVTAAHIEGPVGVMSRNFSNARIEALGWKARTDTRAGVEQTYPWIAEQVQAAAGV
ncbi:MAG: NAD-dependent epimerase/dehydratase family protein [Actinomycetia bacterium]|nr:NAD-dependent epimerase/dehydratase family protein [Actinomycetes bacterium]